MARWWRSKRFRAFGLLALGLAFTGTAFALGNTAEWDPLYVFSSYRGDVVAWLLIGGTFVLGIGSVILGAVRVRFSFRDREAAAVRKTHAWGAKPLFDEHGKRIHYDEG